MRRLQSLIALRFFEETAQHLSFNRAAAALCVAQGAVSRQIRLLEGSLGVDLFERDHTGIRLTSAGLALLPCLTDIWLPTRGQSWRCPKAGTVGRFRSPSADDHLNVACAPDSGYSD
jgi:hypothetical protein